MTSPLKDLLSAARQEAIKAGCTRYDIVHGGKHEKFVVHGLTGKRTITISRSPSCPFVERKVRADVRRAMKELGNETL